MKFRSYVEPPEPMRGLEVPPEVVEALGGGKRPAVTITINGHSWKSRVAIMRGRYLLGLSNANRKAAGVATGDEVEVEVEIDAEPRVVAEPADFTRALDADPIARTAYDRLRVLAAEGEDRRGHEVPDRDAAGGEHAQVAECHLSKLILGSMQGNPGIDLDQPGFQDGISSQGTPVPVPGGCRPDPS